MALSNDISATSLKIKLDASNTGALQLGNATPQTAELISKHLQDNHDKHHIFTNSQGFHCHTAHYLLALYSLQAPPDIITATYLDESKRQRKIDDFPPHPKTDLSDPATFKQHLGSGDYYADYLIFFSSEISVLGWKETVQKYLFSRSPVAEDLFHRLFVGVWHPFIHLGYGIEFEQPAIIAEALAQTASHGTYIKDLFAPIENAYAEANNSSPTQELGNLLDLVNEIQGEKQITSGLTREGVITSNIKAIIHNALPQFTSILSKFSCAHTKESISLNIAKSIHLAATLSAGTAFPSILPLKKPKLDFILMHNLTSSLFLGIIANQDWISLGDRARIINYKVWMDLALYIAVKIPRINLDAFEKYQPKHGKKANWEDVIARAVKLRDPSGGHGIKVIRALIYAERKYREILVGSRGFGTGEKEEDLFVKLGTLCMDTIEKDGGEEGESLPTAQQWITGTGFEELWEPYPNQE